MLFNADYAARQPKWLGRAVIKATHKMSTMDMDDLNQTLFIDPTWDMVQTIDLSYFSLAGCKV